MLAASIAAAAAALDAGLTSVALTEEALARIADDEWTAFVEVSETALDEARERDAELRAGRRRGPLHGIPVSVKDVIDVAGLPTRCGSDAYERVPAVDADAVDLWRAAGAVILGKTSTHEFALGRDEPAGAQPARSDADSGRVERRLGGRGRHRDGACVAWAPTRVRRSACPPRCAASWASSRPTGPCPTRGVVPLSWTMDHVAVMAPTAEDAALALDALRPDAVAIAPAVRRAHLAPADRAADRRVGGRRERGGRGGAARRSTALDVASIVELDRPTAADFGGANAMGLLGLALRGGDVPSRRRARPLAVLGGDPRPAGRGGRRFPPRTTSTRSATAPR